MKGHEPIANDELVSQTLREWKVTASLPPRFQEQVWRRIARAEVRSRSIWQMFAQWVGTTFSRPAVAASYVGLLLFVGLSTGYWQAQGKSAQAESQGRMLYVQSVDPFEAPRP